MRITACINMAYSQALVLAGGIAHVPILITILKFADAKTLKLNKSRAAAILVEKEKAAAEKAEIQKAEKRAAEAAAQAAAAQAAAQSAEAEKSE